MKHILVLSIIFLVIAVYMLRHKILKERAMASEKTKRKKEVTDLFTAICCKCLQKVSVEKADYTGEGTWTCFKCTDEEEE